MVQDRSSEMWIPKNLKLEALSAAILLMWIGSCMPPQTLLKCTISLSVLLVSRSRLLSLYYATRVLYLLSVGCLIVVADEASHRGVVSKRHDGIGSIHRPTVVGEEGVEECARHTTLRYTCAVV